VPRNFLDSLCWTWSVLDTTAFQKKVEVLDDC
jgi:hypothetical protein